MKDFGDAYMKCFLSVLLVFLPGFCYATIGLGGLVLFDYLFYAIAAVALLALLIYYYLK